ncbi:hypothetical protein AB0L88_03155 [Saccharopolyspora shandongensis]|uniref:hypothetical protein n=1 Tax=Saccharopolyspora shandongensis TaxID=418495 RepID=UPI0034292A13
MTAVESAPVLYGAVLLPLLGAPCAVCAHAARYVDGDRHVIHNNLRLRPCPLPPNPTTAPAVPTDFAEVTQ